jgi:hypothetical protein
VSTGESTSNEPEAREVADPRSARAGWALALAVLAGCAVTWSLTLGAAAVELGLGALKPRQLQIEAAARRIEELPEAPAIVVLALDPEDTAFARYRLYPRRVIEAPVRPRERLEAALAAAPAESLVLVADPLALAELARLVRAQSADLERIAELDGDVSLLRLRP